MKEKSKIKILDWDSQFFEQKVAELILNANDISNLKQYLLNAKEDGIQLLYLKYKRKIDLDNFTFQLVDEKVTFKKEIIESTTLSNNIQSFTENEPNNALYEYAILSGQFSRFKMDDKIEDSKFEELYKIWIRNSVNRKFAKEVLVYTIEQEIAGMITIGAIDNTSAHIGLIAVGKNYQGKGIGKALIKASENWSLQQGYTSLQVVTQAANTSAMQLYKAANYVLVDTSFVYHVWL